MNIFFAISIIFFFLKGRELNSEFMFFFTYDKNLKYFYLFKISYSNWAKIVNH